MKDLCKVYPNVINSARGLGTFSSLDGVNVEIRDKIVQRLRNSGNLNYLS